MVTLNASVLVVITLSTVLQTVCSQSHDFSDAVLDAYGQQINCGWGPSRQECPVASYCNIAPNDAYAYCARSKKQLPYDAIIDAGGNAIECTPEWNCGTHDASCKSDPSYPTMYCARRDVRSF